MTCPDRSRLLLYLDGELSPEESHETALHISECMNCELFVSSQTKLESLWRESWIDPPPKRFEKMRFSVASASNLRKKQTIWYFAAVLLVVYLGIKVFYTGGDRRDLATMAAEESAIVVSPDSHITSSEETTEEPLFSSRTEAGQSTMVEQEVTSGGAPQSELPDNTQRSAGVNGSLEQISADEVVSPPDMTSPLSAVGSAPENEEFIASLPEDETLLRISDAEKHDNVLPENELSHGFTVRLSAETGDEIERDEWPSLFQLIDSWCELNGYYSGESLVLYVDETGGVTGNGLLDGYSVAPFKDTIGGITVFVLFH